MILKLSEISMSLTYPQVNNKIQEYNESMSFIYEDLALPLKEEFPSDLPPSMSDEELEQLKKQYRENHRSKRENKPEVERIDTEDIIEQI